MYGTSWALTEPPEQNQCNKCDSQRIHRAKALDGIGRKEPLKTLNLQVVNIDHPDNPSVRNEHH